MSAWSTLNKEAKADAIRAALEAGAGSASEVALEFGVSRNVIIGYCHRADIALPGNPNRKRRPRATPAPRQAPAPRAIPGPDCRTGQRLQVAHVVNRVQARQKVASRPERKPPTPPAAVAPIVASKPVPFIGRKAWQCAWIIDPDSVPVLQRRCCGAPVVDVLKRHLCREHKEISEQSRATRQAERA